MRPSTARKRPPPAKSGECSGCGAVTAKLPLRVRVFHCDRCGLALDRDLNAARNLAQLVTELGGSGTGVAGDPGTHVPNGRLSRRKTPPRGADGVDASTPQRVSA